RRAGAFPTRRSAALGGPGAAWRPPLAERISGGNLNGPATEGPDEVLAVQRRSQRAGGEVGDRLHVGRLIACCSGQRRYSGELPRDRKSTRLYSSHVN